MALLMTAVIGFFLILLIGFILKIYTIGKLKDIDGFGHIVRKESEPERVLEEL